MVSWVAQELGLLLRPAAVELLNPQLLDKLSSQSMITLEATIGCNSDSAAGVLFHSSSNHTDVGSFAQQKNSGSLQICEQPGRYLVGQPLLDLQLPAVGSRH